MKYALVTLFLFAFTTCATLPDLEASIDKDRIIECIRGAEPLLEDVVELIEAFQTKKIWQNLVPIATKIVTHVKQAVGTCAKKENNEIVLEGWKDFWRKVGNGLKKVGKFVVDNVVPLLLDALARKYIG
jgi:hypothetical protein